MVLPVNEDMPPDMVAGSMDLRVVLPDGHAVKMSVERSTPMMDLLVQVTTLNKMTPAGHVLQVMGEHGVLPYKPNTPIGALEAWTLHIMPKNKAQAPIIQKKAPLKPANQQQPFEQTFRLQVHLPRNQLYVMRVSPRTLLCDILEQTCSEKNLDPSKYEMRHPADLSQMLSPSCSLADYGLQEITVVARSKGLGQALSSSDIMALQREEEKRRQAVRQQQSSTGMSLVFSKHSRSSMCEGSVSSDSLGGRSISPARSDESASRSVSPPAPAMAPPIRPARKRRPAPKPPAQAQKQNVEEGVNVSHSRNSSDSSGYHEASVLSDGPADMQHIPDTLPRRNKSQAGLSRSMSNLTAVSLSGQKKKKAPPPPPVNKTTSLERHLSGKSNNQPLDKCSTLPGKMKMLQQQQEAPVEYVSELAPIETVPAPVEFASPSENEEAIDQVEEAFSCIDEDMDIQPAAEDAVDDWQYQLPAPPTAFRDSDSPTLIEEESVDLSNTQVFAEPELDVNKSVMRTNPLFIAQEYDVDVDDIEAISMNTEHLDIEIDKCEFRNRKDSSDSVTKVKQRSNETKSRDDIMGGVSREDDLGFGQQINELNSRESKQSHDDTDFPENKKFVDCDDTNAREYETKCRDSSIVYDMNSTKYTSDVSQQYNESESVNIATGELPNFTITTYQRPRVIEEIYTDDEKANFITKPTKLYLHQKFNSTTTLNTNLSRTNSFSDEAEKQPTSVKRSTSHISLTFQPNSTLLPSKTISVNNLAEEEKREREDMKDDEHKCLLELQEQFLQLQKQLLQNSNLLEKQSTTADAPLQSLQVLRSILGQQQVRSKNYSETLEYTPNSKSPQDRQTQSKEDVQIEKSLQNGRNSKGLAETQNSKIIQDRPTNESENQTSVVTVNDEKPIEPKRYVYRGPPAVNLTTWSERPKSQVSIKMDGDYRIGVGQSNHNKSVNMDRPAVNVSYTKDLESSATVGLQHNDPSRVPIVRSVELKKSFIEQQNRHKTTTLLNGGSSLAANQRNEDDTKFVGVNSLAKRFSAHSKAENIVPHKYTSVVGIGSDSAPSMKKTPGVVRVNGFTAPKHLMPVVKGFQFAANKDKQTDSVSVRSSGTDQPPPFKKSVARPNTLAVANPRDQLMDAIRDFGGGENLRQQSPTQDNVVIR